MYGQVLRNVLHLKQKELHHENRKGKDLILGLTNGEQIILRQNKEGKELKCQGILATSCSLKLNRFPSIVRQNLNSFLYLRYGFVEPYNIEMWGGEKHA